MVFNRYRKALLKSGLNDFGFPPQILINVDYWLTIYQYTELLLCEYLENLPKRRCIIIIYI